MKAPTRLDRSGSVPHHVRGPSPGPACIRGPAAPSMRFHSADRSRLWRLPMQASQPTAGPQLQIAVFIDFENIALGLRDSSAPFEVRRILDRLLEKGKVIAKVAYA